jgi:hypothetical protein
MKKLVFLVNWKNVILRYTVCYFYTLEYTFFPILPSSGCHVGVSKQAIEVGFNLPSSEDFLKELSSGGLSVARFRHPAGLNGCRAAAPPLLRLCVGIRCSLHQVVHPWQRVCRTFSRPHRRSGGGGRWRTWSHFRFCSRVSSAKL